MICNQRLSVMVIGFLVLLFALGCALTLTDPTPLVVTQEVTRLVVVTATSTHTPVIVERVITVTVVVSATPMIETMVPQETPPIAITPPVTEQLLDRATPTMVPDSGTPTAVSSPNAQPPVVMDDLDDPVDGLAALSEIAKVMQAQGTHTLRLSMDLSILIEVTVRNQQNIDDELTNLVRDELSRYDIQGNYIIDISVDDLAQQEWVIESLGGVVGLGTEEVTELRQIEDTIWERINGGEWSLRLLTSDEALLPLGNSLVTIDAYSHALNLSDLILDALRPLLLTTVEEQPVAGQVYGWTSVTDTPSTDSLFSEIRRERAMPSSNNLNTITAALANSGLSMLVDPAAVTNGIQQITSVERAWLISDTWLVDHGQVEIRGQGVVEATYLMQQRLLDATVIVKTANSFEYLSYMTVVTAPNQ